MVGRLVRSRDAVFLVNHRLSHLSTKVVKGHRRVLREERYVVEVCECLSGRSKRLAKGHSVLGPRVIEKKRRGLKVYSLSNFAFANSHAQI